ncbi:PREDICTED: quinone oxidoreductase PIG3-like, partial [Amphimedon queenslandica]|uniref:Enoyl reductase (ER) domain-containing protein n=2 Tax=Amphimedon queenslandica TaxID=400682 RepID=A0AAN0K1C8_AMPQE
MGRGLFLAIILLLHLKPKFIFSDYCYTERDCAEMEENTMKSISHNTSDASLRLVNDTTVPPLKEGDVLIKVSAAGVNRLDLLQVRGLYPPPPGESEILGVEVSGTIVSLSPLAGSNSGFKIGDRVMALIGGGGYAEYCTAPYQCVMAIPQSLSFDKAAAIPEAYLTAYQGLVWNGDLQDNQTVLIHAGASSVGLAAIQLARVLREGVVVIATSRTEEKLVQCTENGAHFVINSKEKDFKEEVMRITEGKGVDVILDFIGGSYWDNNIASLATDGHIVLLGMLGGVTTPSPVNLGLLLKKRLTVKGSTLRSRSLPYKERLVSEVKSIKIYTYSNFNWLKVFIE